MIDGRYAREVRIESVRLYKVGDFIRNLYCDRARRCKGEFSSNDMDVCFRSIFNCKLTEALNICICFWNTQRVFSCVDILNIICDEFFASIAT